MKTLALAIATTALTATAATAGVSIADVDQNGDRFASVSELTAVYPGLKSADFNDIDMNDDRRISANELLSGVAQTVLGKYAQAANEVAGISAIDTDNSGQLSAAELAAAYPGFGATDFDDIDMNDDRRVSANELYSPVGQAVVTRFEAGAMEAVSLSEVDTDGSRFVTFDELNAAYPGVSALDFRAIDGNRDNRISLNELYASGTLTVLGRSGS